MGVVIQIGQLILALSILIILHEFGHFAFARLFKTRVEKFYLFFDAWFSLFKWKKGDTEYGIGWLPLGGYVKISGMIDESMDKEAMKQEPKPYEFRSKKPYQRLLIMVGGVLVNVLLGIAIYISIMAVWGEKYLPVKNMTDGIWVVDSTLQEVGLRTGDKVLTINGTEPEVFGDILEEMLYAGTMVVDRQGETVEIDIPEDFSGTLVDNNAMKKGVLYYARMPFIISEVIDTMQNANSGLLAKDKIIGVDSISFKYYDEYLAISDTMRDKEIVLTVERGDEQLKINSRLNENGKIGVIAGMLGLSELEKLGYIKQETHDYNLVQAIPAGFGHAREKMASYIRQFKLIFNFKTGAYKGVGGFGAITGLFPQSWNWQVFWELTAFLSLMLAFLNIMPIPALDGGHVMFLLYEMVTGRKPSDKFMEYAQVVGMVLLLALLLFANGNDIFRAFFNK